MADGKKPADGTISFNQMVQNARDRRKCESLAQRIFKPIQGLSKAQSLSRACSLGGINKRVAPSGSRRSSSNRNLEGEWMHDRHTMQDEVDDSSSRFVSRGRRHERTIQRSVKPAVRLVQAFERAVGVPEAAVQARVHSTTSRGIAIRGQAGPTTVVAENFAPGTSEEDIVSALDPNANDIKIIQTEPVMVVEMVFTDRLDAEDMVRRFDKKKADGRVLKLYIKVVHAAEPADLRPPLHTPKGPRAQVEARQDRLSTSGYVDGSMGFTEPMDISPDMYDDDQGQPSHQRNNRAIEGRAHGNDGRAIDGRTHGNAHGSRANGSRGNGNLYSDAYVRRGRGFDNYRPSRDSPASR